MSKDRYSSVTAVDTTRGHAMEGPHMANSTIRRWLSSRRTRAVGVVALVLVVLGTTAAVGAYSDHRSAKRIELGESAARRAKRVGRPAPTSSAPVFA